MGLKGVGENALSGGYDEMATVGLSYGVCLSIRRRSLRCFCAYLASTTNIARTATKGKGCVVDRPTAESFFAGDRRHSRCGGEKVGAHRVDSYPNSGSCRTEAERQSLLRRAVIAGIKEEVPVFSPRELPHRHLFAARLAIAWLTGVAPSGLVGESPSCTALERLKGARQIFAPTLWRT